MPHVALAVSLPEHVARFDPVRRRIPGAQFLLLPGRWPAPGWDSRRATLQALVSYGSPPVIEQPAGDLDWLVFHGECPPARLRPYLRDQGQLAVWRDGLQSPLRFAVDEILAAAPAWLGSRRGTVCGDPRLDAVADPGAATRARARLGVGAPGTRPLVVVLPTQPLREEWGQLLVRLRTEADLVFMPTSLLRMQAAPPWPRCVAGPGVYVASAHPLADLLAAAALVVSDHPAPLWDAISVGRPVLGLCEGRFRAVRSSVEAAAAGLPWVEEPHRLGPALTAALAGRIGVAPDPRLRTFRPDRPAGELMADALYQSIGLGAR